jgi:hypothetical protein
MISFITELNKYLPNDDLVGAAGSKGVLGQMMPYIILESQLQVTIL